MNKIKLFEDFINNNQEGSLINANEIISCIKNGGHIYARIIKGLPNNDPNIPLTPLSIDEDNLITVEFEGNEYEIPLKNITKISL